MFISTMKKLGQDIKERFRLYLVCTTGAIAIAFAFMAPVVLGSAGMALDLAQSYNVRQRLCGSLDAAALAAAASSSDEDEINDRVDDFFAANYPEEAIGFTYDLNVDVTDEDVIVSSYAQYNTSFMSVLGIEEMTIYCETVVHREVRGLEVALVLDNTGSMSTNNNIDALRDATESFIDILFDATSEEEYVRIGLVPYANSVRIGRYGLGLNPDGSPRGNPEAFVTLPPDVNYTDTHSSSGNWYGCVVAHHPDGYDENANYVAGSYGQLWESGGDYDGHGWDVDYDENDPYPQDITDDYTGPWDIYMSGDFRETTDSVCVSEREECTRYEDQCVRRRRGRCVEYDRVCTRTRTVCDSYDTVTSRYWRKDSRPNDGCPYAYIRPLTSDRDELQEVIDDMQPHGNTLGNVGMLWGYRLLTPEMPFDEAAEWEDTQWRKAIIMMTDGDNTRDSQYNYFWDSQRNDISVTDYNERFVETCDAMKDQGILVYTITFYSNISDDTKAYYRSCATSEDQYYDAPSQEDLIDVFERISRELSQIHIRS